MPADLCQPRPLRDRLQLAAFAMVTLVVSLAAAMHFGGAATSPFQHLLGDDLVPSYMAGTFVREGRTDLLTDYAAAERFQARLREQAGLNQHGRTGPWLNPPFYAAVFVPLSALPYRAALWTWFSLNLLMLSGSLLLLYRMLPADRRRPVDGIVIAALVLVSMPCLQAMACQQNTFLSLLILCGAITLARADKPFAAGAVAALLLFKPQLAVIVCGALICTLGWRALAGMATAAVVLLAPTAFLMPGAIADYLHKLPALLPYLRTDRPYPWERQTTFLGFWRLLLGGRTGGPNPSAVTILWLIGAAAVALMLAAPLWNCFVTTVSSSKFGFATKARRARSDAKKSESNEGEHRTPNIEHRTPNDAAFAFFSSTVGVRCSMFGVRLSHFIFSVILRAIRALMVNPATPKTALQQQTRDRLLAATIAASPLLMPYYMDYDLLLLAAPAVLLAAERMQTGKRVGDRRIIAGWAAVYGFMYVNAAVADATGMSVIVLLMVIRFAMPARLAPVVRDGTRAGGQALAPQVRGARQACAGQRPDPNAQVCEHAGLLLARRRTQRLSKYLAMPGRRLWVLPAASACIAVIMALTAGVLDRSSPLTFGHDLLPGYTAGRLVLEGHAADLYSADATRPAGRAIIADQNLTNEAEHVLWLNPPHYALLLAPLSAMPYRGALLAWLAMNTALATGAVAAILRWIPNRRHAFWLGVAAITSCPFLLAVEHQQSTFLSLAILTAAVTAWRADRPMLAGLLVGLLAYKPQLAIAVGIVLIVCQGRVALAGMLISGAFALAAGELMSPGSTGAFLTAAPASAAFFQHNPGYNWGRQMTPTAFWQTLLGAGSQLATIVGHAVSGGVLIAVAWTARRIQSESRTRSIALAFLAMPLCTPYFMDYDLLLLMVPAALLLTDGHLAPLTIGGSLLWLLIYLNVDVVAATDVNVVVLLLLGLIALLIRGLAWRDDSIGVNDLSPRQPLPLQPARA